MAVKLTALFTLFAAALYPQILTTQYDNARAGAILTETVLKPANVNRRQFGKVFTLAVDGDVYAQPLYVPRVPIPGKGTHDVIFVATEHDTVYAFDAAAQPAEPLWRVNFLKDGVTTVPNQDVACPLIRPEIGITPSPVIDLATGTIYVLARTKESQGTFSKSRYVQKLHALAITTGAEKFGGPVEIKADGFNPLRELPRPGLVLVNGRVILTWSSSCDVAPYHGWVMSYDAGTLAQKAVFNASPDSGESGIWQSDNAPAADEQGNIYVATGNGKFTAAKNGRDYGDTLLKLGASLDVLDYFTPYNEQKLNADDDDLGSGGPVLLPPQPGPHPHLLLLGGKNGVLYVLDRDRLGHYHEGGDSQAVQTIRGHGGIYSAPAFWNGHVYLLPETNGLQDFALNAGQLTLAKTGTHRFVSPGATPAISANGARDGIVWAIETKTWNGADQPAVLRAYDAADVTRELYTSEQNSDRDRAGLALRFTIPTVAAGRVYVEAKRRIDVYGLIGAR